MDCYLPDSIHCQSTNYKLLYKLFSWVQVDFNIKLKWHFLYQKGKLGDAEAISEAKWYWGMPQDAGYDTFCQDLWHSEQISKGYNDNCALQVCNVKNRQ